MWFTLIWIEDPASATRSTRDIFRILVVGKKRQEELQDIREGLHVVVCRWRLVLHMNFEELFKTSSVLEMIEIFRC